jgi:hypothetical protein
MLSRKTTMRSEKYGEGCVTASGLDRQVHVTVQGDPNQPAAPRRRGGADQRTIWLHMI